MAATIEERLRSAARRLFSQGGYSGTTLRQILADAHAAPNSIYRCFGSKQELFREVVLSSANDLLRTSRFFLSIQAGGLDGDFTPALIGTLRHWFAALPRDAACLLMQASLSDDPRTKHTAASVVLTTVQILAARLELEQNLRPSRLTSSAAEAAQTIIHSLFQCKAGTLFLDCRKEEAEALAVDSVINRWIGNLFAR